MVVRLKCESEWIAIGISFCAVCSADSRSICWVAVVACLNDRDMIATFIEKLALPLITT